MYKRTFIVLSGVVALTACQGVIPRYVFVGEGVETALRAKPDAEQVEVYVDRSGSKPRIVVNQEPIYARSDPAEPRKKKIKFKLEQGYAFADNGIEICPSTKGCKPAPRTPPECRPMQGGGRTIQCTYDDPGADILYYYTVKVMVGKEVVILDPSIWN